MSVSTIKKNVTDWTLLTTADLSVSADETLTVPTEYSEFLVEIGRKNNTQVFGGTNVLMVKNQNHPIYLTLYDGNGAMGLVYIHLKYNNTELLIGNQMNQTARYSVYAR